MHLETWASPRPRRTELTWSLFVSGGVSTISALFRLRRGVGDRKHTSSTVVQEPCKHSSSFSHKLPVLVIKVF